MASFGLQIPSLSRCPVAPARLSHTQGVGISLLLVSANRFTQPGHCPETSRSPSFCMRSCVYSSRSPTDVSVVWSVEVASTLWPAKLGFGFYRSRSCAPPVVIGVHATEISMYSPLTSRQSLERLERASPNQDSHVNRHRRNRSMGEPLMAHSFI